MTLSTVDFCFSLVEIVLRILLDRDSLGKTGGNLRRAVGTRDISSFVSVFILFLFLFISFLKAAWHIWPHLFFSFHSDAFFHRTLTLNVVVPSSTLCSDILNCKGIFPGSKSCHVVLGKHSEIFLIFNFWYFFRLSHLLISCLFLRLDWISDNGSAWWSPQLVAHISVTRACNIPRYFDHIIFRRQGWNISWEKESD